MSGGGEGGRRDWSWVRAHMPRVAQLLEDARALHGREHVNRCWAQGVAQGRPGHFFAAQGPIMLGTPTAAQMLDWLDPEPGAVRPEAVLHLADAAPAQGVTHGGA